MSKLAKGVTVIVDNRKKSHEGTYSKGKHGICRKSLSIESNTTCIVSQSAKKRIEDETIGPIQI